MSCCDWCALSETDRKYLLYENNYWSVFLADKQDYIGRCIVVARSHVQSLSDLPNETWIALKSIICSLEALLKGELGATMFNWSCLMNDAYKSTAPQPHVHFHVRPRYAEAVSVEGKAYRDEEFAHHYNNSAKDLLDNTEQQGLYDHLKSKVHMYF